MYNNVEEIIWALMNNRIFKYLFSKFPAWVRNWYLSISLGFVLLAGINYTVSYNYLLFHSLAEIFSIIISAGIFMIAWNSRRYMKNNYFLVIGVSFLFTAGLDLIHTLSYRGMSVFPNFNANLPTQLWVAARFLQAISLLVAPLLITKRSLNRLVVAPFFIATLLAVLSIFYWKNFPVAYVEGVGQTQFKIISEYIITLIFLSSIFLLFKKRRYFDKSVFLSLVAATLLIVFSEILFIYYSGVYSFFNMLGHNLKIIAYFVFYVSIIEMGLKKPYNILFREAKLKQEDLEKERNKVQKYLDVARFIFIVIDADQKVTLINRKGSEILGYEEKEIIGKNWFTNFLPKKEKVKSLFLKLLKGKMNLPEYFENSILTKSGEERLIAWHNVALKNRKGKVISVLSSGEDITERKIAEEKLKESEARYRSVTESASDAIISTDSDGKIIAWNRGAEIVFGYSEKEVLGMDLTIIMPEEYRILHSKSFFAAVKNREMKVPGRTYEVEGLRKNGAKFPIELSVASWNMGKRIFFTGIVRDITDRKLLEAKKDEFISIASHELKTPITTLKAFSQILKKRLENSRDARNSYLLSSINDQVDKLTNLINDLLDVSKIEAGKLVFHKTYFDLNELVRKIIIDFQYTTDTHEITKEGSIKDAVYGDDHRIGQVLSNLITNAIKYSPKGGKIIIKLAENNKNAIISVKDFGPGISKDDRKKIFERFYRAGHIEENNQSGFGLGLYISKEIVRRHRGKIWVESEAGKGSTFYFTLPVKKAAKNKSFKNN